MLFYQSTSTFHKYFPDLGLEEYEHEQGLIPVQPIQSISRLASEILRFTQSRRIGNAEELQYCIRARRSFARFTTLRTVSGDGIEVEEEEKSSDPTLNSEAAGEDKAMKNSWDEMPKFLLAGAVSTVISRTFVAPLERIKLECIVHGSKDTWLKIVKWIWVSEGPRGFWKGNALNLFRMVPFKSLNFILYDMYLDHLLCSEKKEITNHDRLVGGGISGVMATVVCLPLDTIRTRLVAQGGEALGGVSGCFFQMIRNEGFLSLYKGLTPALISMGPSSAVFYAVYDILKSSYLSHKKNKLGNNSKDIGVVWTLTFGAIAGACAEAVTYPLEVIRRQLQLQQSANLGLATAFVKTIEKDGVGSLYAGLFPSTLQVLPSAALSYLFYEMMKSVLKIS